MEKKDAIKLLIALGLFAGAGAFYLVRASSGDDAPDTEESKTAWFCSSCNQGFELTALQMTEQVATHFAEPDAAETTDDQTAALGRGSKRIVRTAKCPTCGQFSGDAAYKCGECQTIFRAATKTGRKAICPKCHWDPITGKPADAYRLEEGLDE